MATKKKVDQKNRIKKEIKEVEKVTFELSSKRDEDKNINYNPNQFKAFQNKYLRNSPSVYTRLEEIADAIALSGAIHDPDFNADEVLDGINYKLKKGEDGLSDLLLIHDGLTKHNDRMNNFYEFRDRLQNFVDTNENAFKRWKAKSEAYTKLLANWDFVANSPTMMNAGRPLGQLSACYVLDVEDSIEGWMDAAHMAARIHQSGGGTGFSGHKVRPAGSEVRTTKGVASGSLSPMKIIDGITDQIKQGGTRRGANMYEQEYNHPDIMQFITCKKELDANSLGVVALVRTLLSQMPGFEKGDARLDKIIHDVSWYLRDNQIANFNISVSTNDEFWSAVLSDGEYDLIDPHTEKVTDTVKAQDVFQAMIDGAWETGDPGYIVRDRINNSGSNTTPHIGEIYATNPCGEQPLLPNEPCNLGSINLGNFVITNGGGKLSIDYNRLGDVVDLSVNFLDDVIDINNYPDPNIEVMAKTNRRIGLGVMGWADMLIHLGIPYDSDKATNLMDEVEEFINNRALKASEDLASERGVFVNWKGSAYDPESEYFREDARRPRHCARTTIAPTGTISQVAGCSSGIEPLFGLTYTRMQAEAVDSAKKGEKADEQFTYTFVDDKFIKVAEENDYWGFDPDELLDKIKQKGSAEHVEEIPRDVRDLFKVSHDISYRRHIDHLAATQRHTDNAVSKTINMANDATRDDIADAYLYAYESGVKGLTIYRDGSKFVQVLNLSGESGEKNIRYDLEEGVPSMTYVLNTGMGKIHANVAKNPNGTPRFYFTTTPQGTEPAGLLVALGIAMSKACEFGYPVEGFVKHFTGIKGDSSMGFGEDRVDSAAHGVAKIIKKYNASDKKMEISFKSSSNGSTNGNGNNGDLDAILTASGRVKYCENPECHSPNIDYTPRAGCKGGYICKDCGNNKCS